MEEKERYEYYFGTNTVKDNINKEFLSYKRVIDTLNQQDRRIKELENQFSATEEMRLENLNNGCRCVERDSKIIVKLQQENQKLKERIIELQEREESYINTMRYLNKTRSELLNLPKKIMEDIKLQLFNHFKVKNIEEYEKLPLIDSLFTADTVIEILATILKKYGGENE